MSTTQNSISTPSYKDIADLIAADPHYRASWDEGVEQATRHAATESQFKPGKSILCDRGWAVRTADTAWVEGRRMAAVQHYGYAAQAVRLDPEGGRAIVG